jgi:inorganic pyrophosphatase
LLDVAGEVSYVVITIPAKPSEQVIAATDFASLTQHYPAVKEIIQQWFIHHNPNQRTRVMGWKDEKYTNQLISRWLR